MIKQNYVKVLNREMAFSVCKVL